MKLILFDLDRTLFKKNCSFTFGQYLYKQQEFSTSTMLSLVAFYFQHRFLGMPLEKLHEKSFKKLFFGRSASSTHQHAHRFLTQTFSELLYVPAACRLKEALARGDKVAILSSSPDFLVSKVAQLFEVNEWGATYYEENQTGEWSHISKLFEGKEKAAYALSLANRLGLSSKDLVAYTDSYLDVPLLEIVGEVVAVNPDRKLRKLSVSSGWEILE